MTVIRGELSVHVVMLVRGLPEAVLTYVQAKEGNQTYSQKG
jgi:hypothetical protein